MANQGEVDFQESLIIEREAEIRRSQRTAARLPRMLYVQQLQKRAVSRVHDAE
jgi:hypothetical protein